MIPVRSIRHLIQEDYYPDEFKVLVCCLLLNRTRGKQVRAVLDRVFSKWPTAESLKDANVAELSDELRSLGFQNRRSRTMIRFADAYLREWHDVEELPGIGEYASDCWRIFFLEELSDEAPKDGPLSDYWRVAKEGLWPKEGWGRDEEVERRRGRMDEMESSRRKLGRVRCPRSQRGNVQSH
jgi:hypothetical protein